MKIRISVPPPSRGETFGEAWPLTSMPNCEFVSSRSLHSTETDVGRYCSSQILSS